MKSKFNTFQLNDISLCIYCVIYGSTFLELFPSVTSLSPLEGKMKSVFPLLRGLEKDILQSD